MNKRKNSQEEPLFAPIPDETPLPPKKPVKWLQVIVIIGMISGLTISILGAAYNNTIENLTMLMVILFSGIYSLFLFLSRKLWVKLVTEGNAEKNVTIFAIANAFFIIFIGMFNERLIKSTSGSVSISSNFNLLTSIPWLIGIILIFVPIQKKQRFSWMIVLILSGCYEFVLETVQNGILIPFLSGQSINFLNTISDLLVLGFWQFVVLYSPIYLVIYWTFDYLPVSEKEKKKTGWDALKPLLWIFPYSIYFLILFLLFS